MRSLTPFRAMFIGLAGLAAYALACTATYDLESLDDGVCPSGQKECEGMCVADDLVTRGCGGESCSPCNLPNVQAICTPSGECEIGSCVGGFEDCNGQSADGCEVNTDFDADNCGGCGLECEDVPNAERGCANGFCAVGGCSDANLRDCNGAYSDGCETNVSTSIEHCGRCGVGCMPGSTCVDGSCA